MLRFFRVGDETTHDETDAILAVQEEAEPEPEPEPVPEPEQGAEPILWHSNAPWCGSGYGTQTALFGPRLQRDLGHPVAFSSFFGLKGKRLGWVDPSTSLPFTVYPGGRDNHGNDVLYAHYKHWTLGTHKRPGWCVFLSDVWVLRAEIASQMPMLAWCPVDHDPVIPQTVEFFEKSNAIPLAMSMFGKEMFEDAGLPTVLYAPHGYDPDIFKPAERADARKAIGLPDTFTVGMVAANLGTPSRKAFSQALTAYAIFHEKYPDSQLYMHTLLQDPLGEDLTSMCNALRIRPYSVDPYQVVLGYPHHMVCAVYNALDVLLNPAMGEGFGVPLIEAQACGTPCIVTDFSAMPEVAPQSVGNWNVGGQKVWTHFNSWQMAPSVEQIVDSLEQAYNEPADERDIRRRSVFEHAKWYSADHVVDKYWKNVMAEARAEMQFRNRQMRRYAGA